MEFFDVRDQWFWLKVVQVVVSIASLVFAVCMAIKKRKVSAVEMLNELMDWVIEAETHTTWSGQEKLDFVINKAFKYSTINHIKYNEEAVTEEVEKILSLSKNVNADEKQKEKALNPLLTGEKIN